MIERIVERGQHGEIERVLERTLSPLEETVALAWPHVKRGLLQHDIAQLEEVEVSIGNVRRDVDAETLTAAIADRITAEAPTFANTRWRRVRWLVQHAGR
jgi:hypothetical protein